MEASLNFAVSQQLNHIIFNHLEELCCYVSLDAPLEERVPPNILTDLENLVSICACSPHLVTREFYEEACQYRNDVETFLARMNQKCDDAFAETYIGRILVQVNQWCIRAAETGLAWSLQEVWNLIAPVVPDHLEAVGDGQYQASWWRPVPMMDIAILQRTDGVIIHGEPFEPPHLPGGLALRFSLSTSA